MDIRDQSLRLFCYGTEKHNPGTDEVAGEQEQKYADDHSNLQGQGVPANIRCNLRVDCVQKAESNDC